MEASHLCLAESAACALASAASSSHTAAVFKEVSGNLLRMARHKFSSNVLEQCFVSGNAKQHKQLVDEILSVDKTDKSTLVLIGMIKAMRV